jgi:SAM-dependent methyltransferase
MSGKDELLALFRDPRSGAPLAREADALVSPTGARYPIVRGVPRFVDSDAYVASFSYEWNAFPTTQLDVHTGERTSEEILVQKTGLSPEQVRGRLVLDAGVGAGRFADVLSRWGARVVGVDLSFAIEAAARNLGEREDVALAQADIMQLPFAPGTFDLVVSIGVLHHTPDARLAFSRLVPLLKPGGEACLWVYPATDSYVLRTHWVPFVRKIPPAWFHDWCRWFVPYVQSRPRSPLVRYVHQLFEWSDQGLGQENDVLDTVDGYSPHYHSVHTPEEVVGWFQAEELTEVRTFPWDTAVRGRRPG